MVTFSWRFLCAKYQIKTLAVDAHLQSSRILFASYEVECNLLDGTQTMVPHALNKSSLSTLTWILDSRVQSTCFMCRCWLEKLMLGANKYICLKMSVTVLKSNAV